MNGKKIITVASKTTSIDNTTRKIVKVPPKKVVALFIGGAADKKSYYGQGPNYNIRAALRSMNKRLAAELKNGTYQSIYLGYDDVKGKTDVASNVESKIKDKSSGVYIIGHSLGAWNGAHLSSHLSSAGYDVEMLITLDPVGQGMMVWIGSDLFRRQPRPKTKFWINVRAEMPEEDDQDSSDGVADFGGQWALTSGPNINKVVALHHYDAGGIFQAPVRKNESSEDLMYESVRIFLNES